MTREDVINKASSYIKPTPYENPNTFTRWYFKNNLKHAWCGVFIYYIIKHDLGSDMLDSCSNIAYVPTIYKWAKEKGCFNSDFTKAKAGDLVIYNWYPTTQKDNKSHVGFVSSVTSDTITSIDGNTNNEKYDKNCVAKRTRNKKYIVGIVSLPYEESGNMFKYGDYVECLEDTKLYTTIEKKENLYTIKKGDIAFVRSTRDNKFIALAEKEEPHKYFSSAWTDELDNFTLVDYKKLFEEEKELNQKLKDKIKRADAILNE